MMEDISSIQDMIRDIAFSRRLVILNLFKKTLCKLTKNIKYPKHSALFYFHEPCIEILKTCTKCKGSNFYRKFSWEKLICSWQFLLQIYKFTLHESACKLHLKLQFYSNATEENLFHWKNTDIRKINLHIHYEKNCN